jgi:hypothetical protein
MRTRNAGPYRPNRHAGRIAQNGTEHRRAQFATHRQSTLNFGKIMMIAVKRFGLPWWVGRWVTGRMLCPLLTTSSRSVPGCFAPYTVARDQSRTRLVGAKSVGAPEDRNQLWEACLFTHKEYVTLVMKKRAACSAMMSPNYLVFFFNEITQHSRISKIRMIFSLLHL